MKSFLLTTGVRASAAAVVAIGLTAAVGTFAAEDAGRTQLKVVTHLDTDQPGRLNERLAGVDFIPDCQVGPEPLMAATEMPRTGQDGADKVTFKNGPERGARVTCRVTAPTSFYRDGKTYSLTPKRPTIERGFRAGTTGTVRFSYRASE